jgi:hypothetical protein
MAKEYNFKMCAQDDTLYHEKLHFLTLHISFIM